MSYGDEEYEPQDGPAPRNRGGNRNKGKGKQGGGQFALDPDYIDVAARIREFRTAHPNGSLRPVDPSKPYRIERLPVEIMDSEGEPTGQFSEQVFIVYVAEARRTPDDAAPGIGSAWEPFPGRTPYTRNSELQNAETSAWGRAIVASLASDTKSVASADEIRNRMAEQGDPQGDPQGGPVDAEAAKVEWEARFRAARDAWSETVRSLTDDEKVAVIAACEAAGIASPKSTLEEVPRTVDLYDAWRGYAEQAIASRARDATSEVAEQPVGPNGDGTVALDDQQNRARARSAPAEVPQEAPAAMEASALLPLSEVVREMAERRDGAATAPLGAMNDAMAERIQAVAAQDAAAEHAYDPNERAGWDASEMRPEAVSEDEVGPDDGVTDAPVVDPHDTGDDGETATGPVPEAPAAEPPPPKSKWVTLSCYTCKKDIRGYPGMACPTKGCEGKLEEPF